MKPKYIGLIILVFIIVVTGIFITTQKNKAEEISLNGYLGGEKIGLFEDPEFKKLVKKEYGVEFNYSKAGSLDMVTANKDGRDYLFPSSQTALDLYENINGKALSSEIVFNTPIVIYTRKPVLEAFLKKGLVTEQDSSYFIDMVKLTELIEKKTSWADLGLSQLYGNVKVHTTDPAKSNSGNMFTGLLANSLNKGQVVDQTTIDEILPRIKSIISELGYMETSSSDLFDQFLKTGLGAKPMIAGYENQILEFAVERPQEYESVKDDFVILYPTPTVWSSHIYIALNDKAKKGISPLIDKEVQKIAWNRHGFRTGVSGGNADISKFGVKGIPKEIVRIMPMPNAKTMDIIVNYLNR